MIARRFLLLWGSLLWATGQGPVNSSSGPDPAVARLNEAYTALRARDYEQAIARFRAAIAAGADRSAVRQDLAYTLLKIGESEAARDEFGAALRLEPGNANVALEYAFLCHETGKSREARLLFESFREHSTPQVRETARTAFGNIDGPLAAGIARWEAVTRADAANFSAHEELARLAEQRNKLALSAANYQKAWQLRRDRRDLMVGLGRVLLLAGETERGNAWLLAASRGSEPHTAETARSLLPSRYPYVNEFRRALEAEPGNIELRRELAYLLLAMNQRPEAEAELRIVAEKAPADRLARRQLSYLWGEKVEPEPLVAGPLEAKRMGEASLEKSYLNDALRYFRIANEADPEDAEVMLKLGWVHNMLKQDREALEWFDRARRAGDPKIAEEARKAYVGLKPDLAPVRTTFWLFPFYSSRWRDAFTYGQLKAEVRAPGLPVRPYLSARFIGDAGRGIRYLGIAPGQLSENSTVIAGGLITPVKNGFLAWGEAGQAIRFHKTAAERSRPDFRGGMAWSKGWGKLLGADGGGWFTEANADAVYVSAFGHDALFVPQTRFGYTLGSAREGEGLQIQLLWNSNVSFDARRQAWANFVEGGPGMQLRWAALPPNVRVGVHLLRGVYLLNRGNSLRPNFWDVRAGVWYAFTR